MPLHNHFRHQEYRSERPTAPFHLLQADPPPPRESAEYRQRLQAAGDVFRAANVAAIYLVHGTFVGGDGLGMLRELSRVWPAAARLLRDQQKYALDWVVGDGGNYTAEFAGDLEHGLHRDGQPQIPVRVFQWSSENHHVGRADGAVELLAELAKEPPAGRRVLLWGHSHGGNVFAIITNLLGADEATRDRFFDAARIHYQVPIIGSFDVPEWRDVRELLAAAAHPLRSVALDFVTFGTPVRYGWDTGGYARLLHFVHHRPVENAPEYRAPFPPALEDITAARHGDFVQQVGIAGTNVAPHPWMVRTLLADRRLGTVLQSGLRMIDLPTRLQAGVRVPDEGETLLVDYGPIPGNVAQHAAGHAVYTRREWLLFHVEEVARRLYVANP